MRRCMLAAVVVATALGGEARAVRLDETSGELVPTSVRAKLDGPVALFTVKYVIETGPSMLEQGGAALPLPVLGMVTAATATFGGAEHPLALMGADEASLKFDALAADTRGDGEQRSAVLITGRAGSASLGVASPHSGTLVLEMTVAVPTCFYRDARYVHVPVEWRAVIEVARRAPVPIEASQACEPENPQDDGWIGFPAPELKQRPSGDRIGAFAGRVALGDEHIAHLELDLSAALGDIPRDLATVILVDGSRSMSPEELEAQRQLVATYLAAAPGSRVQVIAYARKPRALLPGWTSAGAAAGRVDRELRAIAQRNGSNFDDALVEAGRWLDRIDGTKRIVLLTDERMADRLDSVQPATFKRLIPAGVLVHVVAITGNEMQPARDEQTHLAPLAAATDGMAVRSGPAAKDVKAVPLDATLLVRPISLDRIEVSAACWTQIQGAGTTCNEDIDLGLPEGTSCSWWGEGDVASGPIIVSGLVWGKRVQRLVTPQLQHGREVARELTARGLLDGNLGERAQAAAQAVDERWSLYAEWGGSAKYTSGTGFGSGGGGTSGGSHDVGIGRGPVGVAAYWPDPDLARQLRPLLAKCGVAGDRIEIALEFTLAEIVNVTTSVTPHDSPAPPASVMGRRHDCVEDALWDSTPMLTHIDAHHTYNVSVVL